MKLDGWRVEERGGSINSSATASHLHCGRSSQQSGCRPSFMSCYTPGHNSLASPPISWVEQHLLSHSSLASLLPLLWAGSCCCSCLSHHVSCFCFLLFLFLLPMVLLLSNPVLPSCWQRCNLHQQRGLHIPKQLK